MPGAGFQLLCGDVRDMLKTLPDNSVSCCITSPPYYGLRAYGIPASIWGGDPKCNHQWSIADWQNNRHTPGAGAKQATNVGSEGWRSDPRQSDTCEKCSAWRGCLGLEPTIGLFVAHIVEVFREVRRVLHPSGTLWLNFGDSYCSDGNLKPKDLCMVPMRVFLALQEDGWWLRSLLPWAKASAMPESTEDRPTTALEYFAILTKSADCYYDREAVRIAANGNRGGGRQRAALLGDGRYVRMAAPKDQDGRTGRHAEFQPTSRARRNTDWLFDSVLLNDENGDPLALFCNSEPFTLQMCGACKRIYEQADYRKLAEVGDDKEKHRVCECGAVTWVSHFATFPTRLVMPMVLAGSSEHGICPECGAPYQRIVEKKPHVGDWHPDPEHKHDAGARNGTAKWAKVSPEASGARMNSNVAAARNGNSPQSGFAGGGAHSHDNPFPQAVTLGWEPTCSHPLFPTDPVPAVILDPFAGSARTGVAALKLDRQFIGIDANSDYLAMSEYQLRKVQTSAPANDGLCAGLNGASPLK